MFNCLNKITKNISLVRAVRDKNISSNQVIFNTQTYYPIKIEKYQL